MISKWLSLHEFSADTVTECLECIEDGRLLLDLDGHAADEGQTANSGYESFDSALNTMIFPAFSAALCIDSSAFAELVQAIRWTSTSENDIPHTIDHGTGQPAEIVISWQGSDSNLMYLAHEVAHAVQLHQSAGSFMPPVARETCAFLGELALVSWAKVNNPDLAAKLLRVWRDDNDRYFSDDSGLLRYALADPDCPYTYRMNYPLARAAAVVMWRSGTETMRVFKAGAKAMALLPLARIADLASQTRNYLPSLALPDSAQPAVDAYRALGAIALLDIDVWKGESERLIKDYYASLLLHLQDRTVFIALDEVRRPTGYATWRVAEDDGTVTLTRQAAPFGDHLLLQKTLQRHLGQENAVRAEHTRSARQEQSAW